MGGEEQKKDNRPSRRNNGRGRGVRNGLANGHGFRTEPDLGNLRRDPAPRADRHRSLGATQQRWPEYNRGVLLGTAIVILAVLAVIIVGMIR